MVIPPFSMSTAAMIEDPLQASHSGSPSSSPRFRPFASATHQVSKARYITSNDPRGYIPVYEYPLAGQWIMMDMDDGYVLWTGIWKALGNSKADIVKMIESQPELAPHIRRVRGGYLKIQGTWLPYEVALRLSRRVAWPIREDLVPLFGPTFPATCLSPDQPGYGQVIPSGGGRRRRRAAPTQTPNPAGAASRPREEWTGAAAPTPALPQLFVRDAGPDLAQRRASLPAHVYAPTSQKQFLAFSTRGSGEFAPLGEHEHGRASASRYAPYPPFPALLQPRGQRKSSSSSGSSPVETAFPLDRRLSVSSIGTIELPPVHLPPPAPDSGSFSLPPISSLDDHSGIRDSDASAVLRRLRLDDEHDLPSTSQPPSAYGSRRYSHPMPPLNMRSHSSVGAAHGHAPPAATYRFPALPSDERAGQVDVRQESPAGPSRASPRPSRPW